MKKAEFVFKLFIFSIIIIIITVLFGLEIWAWITYGNLPPDEVPSWVHWLLLRG